MKQSNIITLENLFDATYNRLNIKSFVLNWSLKRMALNILWGIINLSLLGYGSILMINTSWEIIWFAIVLIYTLSYWIISSLLIDRLIGDEIDNLKQ